MRIPITIKNVGGISDEHLIRAADQSEMLGGIQRAISYIVLSLLDERLVERVTKKSSVQVFSSPPQNGSIVHQMFLEISAHPDVYTAGALTGMPASILANYVTRFIDFAFKQAIGVISDREYETTLRDFSKSEPYFDQLVEKIEPHLAAAHSPINKGEDRMRLKIGDSIIRFDAETKDYVTASNVTRGLENFVGYVSRLNLLTGNGRFCRDGNQKVLSFSQTDSFRSSVQSEILSWSLREKDVSHEADINVYARVVTANSGRIKRLLIDGAGVI